MTIKQFIGNKSSSGGGGADNDPDSYFTDDLVEVILGLTEGPIKGLADLSTKNFFVGDTPLKNTDGNDNFENFTLDIHKGTSAGELIIPRFGGSSSSFNIGTELVKDTPLVRQTTLPDIDWLELRYVINGLYFNDDDGVKKNELRFKVEYKKSQSQTWLPAVLYTEPGTEAREDAYTQRLKKIAEQQTSVEPRRYVVYTGTTEPSPSTEARSLSEVFGHRIFWFNFSNDTVTVKYYASGAWHTPDGMNINRTTTGRWSASFVDQNYLRGIDPGRKGSRRTVWFWEGSTPPTAPLIGDLWYRTSGTLYYNGSSWQQALPPVGAYDPVAGDTVTTQDGIITIKEKISSPAVKELKLRVERTSDVYDIRTTKLSDDSDEDERCDITWESIQEIKAEPMVFPNLAVCHLTGRASDQFSSLPDFSGIYDGRIIMVPSNYNPETRVHSGAWDGTWKEAYTNNPAYVGYDLVMNDRYGLNSCYPVYLDPMDVYEAGVWCDIRVGENDRPQFTFNGLISDPRSGREAVTYVFGIFGGRYFDDGNGYARLKIDKDDPAVHLFTKEDVQSGVFTYSYTEIEGRKNDYTVTFINPDLNWQEDRRRVYDQNSIDVYGRVPEDFIAVGCTSVEEAIARARQKLVTDQTEVETVTFTVNRTGLYIEPYDIVLIADDQMDDHITGRILTANGNTITLRDAIYLEAGFEYFMVVNGFNNGDKVTYRSKVASNSIGMSTKTITLTASFGGPIAAETNFVIEGDVSAKAYRVINLDESEGNPDKVALTVIEVNRNKWSMIHDGEAFVDIPTPVISTDLSAVRGMRITPGVEQKYGQTVQTVRVNWDVHPNKFIRRYEVYYRFNDDDWVFGNETFSTEFTISNALPGRYVFRVMGITFTGQTTVPAFLDIDLTGNVRAVPAITNLRLLNKTGNEGTVQLFQEAEPIIVWDRGSLNPALTDYSVSVYNTAGQSIRTMVSDVERFRYTTAMVLRDVPGRAFSFGVRVTDAYLNVSEEVKIAVRNPAPAAPAVKVISWSDSAECSWNVASIPDYKGSLVWVSSTPNIDTSTVAPTYDMTNNQFTLLLGPQDTRYIKVAIYDSFGRFDLNYSPEYEVHALASGGVDTTPPAVPGKPTVTSVLTANGSAAITATTTGGSEEDFASFDFEVRFNTTGNWTSLPGSSNERTIFAPPGTLTQWRVLGRDVSFNKSAYSAITQHTAIKDSVAPERPSIVNVTPTPNGFLLAWPRNVELDFDKYELVLTKDASFTPIVGTTATHISFSEDKLITGLTPGDNWYIFVRAVDTSGNKSPWSPRAVGVPIKIDVNDLIQPTPGTPAAPSYTATITTDAQGVSRARVIATVTDTSDSVSYVWGITEGTGTEYTTQTATPRLQFNAIVNTEYQIRVRGVSRLTNFGDFSPALVFTTGKDTVAPAIPTGLVATSGFNTLWLKWNSNTEGDFSYYELYESTSTTAPTAATAATYSSITNTYTRQLSDLTTTINTWVRSIDTSGNKSAWSARASGKAVGLSADELDVAISSTSYAASIDAPKVYASLPAANAVSPNRVSVQGVLYQKKQTGSTYSYILASDTTLITGKMVAAQIEAGAIGVDQLAANAVTSEKLTIVARNKVNSFSQMAPKDAVVTADLEGWTVSGGSFSLVTSSALGNATALRILSSNQNSQLVMDLNQMVEVDPTQSYQVTWRALRNKPAGALQARIVFYDAAKSIISGPTFWVTTTRKLETAGGTNIEFEGNNYTVDFAGTPRFYSAYLLPTGAGLDLLPDTQNVLRVPVMPANAAYARLYFFVNTTAGSNNGTAASDVEVLLTGVSIRQVGAGRIHADQINAGSLVTKLATIDTAYINNANIIDVDASKIKANTVISDTVLIGATNGNSLKTLSGWASDPADRVNKGTTLIEPNRIVISATANPVAGTLSGFLAPNTTLLNGGMLATGTVMTKHLTVGAQPVSVEGLTFEFNKPNTNQVSWTSGRVVWVATNGTVQRTAVSAGSAGAWTSGVQYFYWTRGSSSLSYSTNVADTASDDVVLIATYRGGSDLTSGIASTIIDEAGIKTNSLTSNVIKAGGIVAESIALGALSANLAYNGNPDQQNLGIDGWYLIQSTGSAPSIYVNTPSDTNFRGFGPKFFSLNNGATTSDGAGWAMRLFPVVPGTSYKFSIDHCASAITTAGRYIRILGYTSLPSNGKPSYASRQHETNIVGANSGWTTERTTTERTWICPAGIYWATLAVWNWSASDQRCHFDNIEILGAKNTVITPGSVMSDSLVGKMIVGSDLIIDNTITVKQLDSDMVLADTMMISTDSLATIRARANDPAARINSATTKIDPGMIWVSRASNVTMNNWISGSDSTKINGGAISANSVSANVMTIGSRNITIDGITFEHNKPDVNSLSWTAGNISYVDDNGSAIIINVQASSDAVWTTGTLYIYWNKGWSTLSTTTSRTTAFGDNSVVLATYKGGKSLISAYGRTIIDGSFIKTGTVDADQINSGAILTRHMTSNTIEGDVLKVNTVRSEHLDIGSRNIIMDIQFEHNSPSENSIRWSSGTVQWINDAGTATATNIGGDNTAWSSGIIYIYWNKGWSTLSVTTNRATAMAANRILIATYRGGSYLTNNFSRTIIDGGNIKTGTIIADRIEVRSLTVDQVSYGAFTEVYQTSISNVTVPKNALTVVMRQTFTLEPGEKLTVIAFYSATSATSYGAEIQYNGAARLKAGTATIGTTRIVGPAVDEFVCYQQTISGVYSRGSTGGSITITLELDVKKGGSVAGDDPSGGDSLRESGMKINDGSMIVIRGKR